MFYDDDQRKEIEELEIEEEKLEEIEEEIEEKVEEVEEEIVYKKAFEEMEEGFQSRENPVNEKYPSFLYGAYALRALAFFIDLIVISSLVGIVRSVVMNYTGLGYSTRFLSFYNLSEVLIYLFYFTILTYLTNGQTLGKMIFGLRVVSFGEEKLSLGAVFMREFIGRFIMKTIKILYIFPLFSSKKQHPADFFSNTTVVREAYIIEYKTILKARGISL